MELAPTSQRVEFSGGLAKLNFNVITDQQLARITGGEYIAEGLQRERLQGLWCMAPP